MTTFDAAKIPADATVSLEALAHWSLSALYELYKNTPYAERAASEGDDGIENVIKFTQGMAKDKTERAIYTISLPLDENFRNNSTPLYANTLIYTDVPIPSGYETV